MIKNTLGVVIVGVCIFTLSALSSYLFDYTLINGGHYDIDIVALENELHVLKDQIQALESEEELMPIEHSWLTVQEIVKQYPDLIWQADAELGIASEHEIKNAWQAVMIAPPDLVLSVMRLIQKAVPAEVLEIQLDQQQGVLLINILGVIK